MEGGINYFHPLSSIEMPCDVGDSSRLVEKYHLTSEMYSKSVTTEINFEAACLIV